MSSDPDSSRREEYADQRDMEHFWRAAKLTREPLGVRWYLPAVLLLVIISVPWYRPGGEIGRVVLGLPGWVWTSLLCGLGVAALTAWAALRAWRDPDDGDSNRDA